MSQRTTGLYRLLSSAWIYQRLQNLVSRNSSVELFCREHVRAQSDDRILDIGCGTGQILESLPEVEYYGFDLNERYIIRAKEKYGNRGSFWAARVDTATLEQIPPCDIALAIGVLHHLDDAEAGRLFSLARSALKPGGRLITWDPCYADEQSYMSRFMVSLDRGKNVRKSSEYETLAVNEFPRTRSKVRNDMLWMPWTHIILECEA